MRVAQAVRAVERRAVVYVVANRTGRRRLTPAARDTHGNLHELSPVRGRAVVF